MRRWRNQIKSFVSFRSQSRFSFRGKWSGTSGKMEHAKTLYDEYQWRSREKKRYYLASITAFGILGWMFYHHWLGAAISSLLSAPFQKIYEMFRLGQQRTQGYSELRDMLYVLSGSFASGSGLNEGIRDCHNMLKNSHGNRSLFADMTEAMVRAMEEGNASEIDLLQNFVMKCGFPELKQMASIYILCIQTGGNLPKAMMETSDAMLRRLQLWQEIRTRTSQKRLEFVIMTAMIPLLLIAVNGTSNYLEPLYESVKGRCVMTIALISLVSAFLWSIRILEGESR